MKSNQPMEIPCLFCLIKKELKKAAKEISVAKIHEAIEVLQSVITENHPKEIDTIEQIKQLAKAQGFSLEQLGLQLDN